MFFQSATYGVWKIRCRNKYELECLFIYLKLWHSVWFVINNFGTLWHYIASVIQLCYHICVFLILAHIKFISQFISSNLGVTKGRRAGATMHGPYLCPYVLLHVDSVIVYVVEKIRKQVHASRKHKTYYNFILNVRRFRT